MDPCGTYHDVPHKVPCRICFQAQQQSYLRDKRAPKERLYLGLNSDLWVRRLREVSDRYLNDSLNDFYPGLVDIYNIDTGEKISNRSR